MNRIQWLVKGLALSLILVGYGGVSLAQEKPRKPQDGARASAIDELWRQMGQVQRQIIGYEVGDMKRSEPFPADIAQAVPDGAPQKKAVATARDAQKPQPPQKTVPGPVKPPKQRDSTSEAQTDQLWRQITELQKTILKLEIADLNPRTLAAATPAAISGPSDRPNVTATQNPNRISDNDQKPESPQKTIPALERPQPPRAGSNSAEISQLWQQIGQLYKQIVVLEIRDPGTFPY